MEVFGADRTADGVPPVDLRVCSISPGAPMQTDDVSPLSVTTAHGLDAVVGSDLVIMSATRVRPADQYPAEALTSLRQAYDAGATVMSLCSGSFVLGAAGLLDGRACTTHWMHAAELARHYPAAIVNPHALYVDDGRIITSAGTAAGIDACLHLVRREWGTAAPPRSRGGWSSPHSGTAVSSSSSRSPFRPARPRAWLRCWPGCWSICRTTTPRGPWRSRR